LDHRVIDLYTKLATQPEIPKRNWVPEENLVRRANTAA